MFALDEVELGTKLVFLALQKRSHNHKWSHNIFDEIGRGLFNSYFNSYVQRFGVVVALE